jgi:hypothetical protein
VCSQCIYNINNVVFKVKVTPFGSLTSVPGALVSMTLVIYKIFLENFVVSFNKTFSKVQGKLVKILQKYS